MKEYLRKIPEGTIVLFSSGEYSDYNLSGLMKAKADIDPDTLRDEYLSSQPEQMANYRFDEEPFLEFLKEKDLFEEVENPKWMEWFLGCYGKRSTMKVYEGPLLFN